MSALNIRNFTKQSPITKAIQLELVPFGNTRKTIEEKKYLEIDAQYRKEGEAVRIYIDEFIKDVIERTLSKLNSPEENEYYSVEAQNLFKALGTYIDFKPESEEERKNRAEDIRTISSDITKLIKEAMKETVAQMSTIKEGEAPVLSDPGKINSAKFVSDVLPAYIETKYQDNLAAQNKALAAIGAMKGKVPILTKLLISRITALETWMPERVVENFTKHFHDNTKCYRTILDNEDISFSVSQLVTEDMLKDEGYVSFLAQSGIDTYNKAVSGEVGEDGIRVKGVNNLVVEHNHSIRGIKSGKRALPKIDKMDKQIMQPVEKTFSFAIIDEDKQVVEAVTKLHDIEQEELVKLYKAVRNANPEDIAVYGNQIRKLSAVAYSGEPHKIKEQITEKETQAIKDQAGKMSRSALEKALAKAADKVTEPSRMYTMAQINDYMGEEVFARYKELLMEAVSNLRDDGEALECAMKSGAKIRGFADTEKQVKQYANDDWTAVRDLLRMIRRRSSEDIDNDFYDIFDNVYGPVMGTTYKVGNMIRNYITRKMKGIVDTNAVYYGKPDRQNQKWNIGESTLSVRENTILRLDNRYYFYILGAGTKPVDIYGTDTDCEVMTYSKMQKPYQNIPKLTMTRARDFFAENSEAEEFTLTDKLTQPLTITRGAYDLYASGACKKQKGKKGDEKGAMVAEEQLREGLNTVLPIFIQFVNTYTVWDNRAFVLKKAEEYNDLSEFYADVEACETVQEWKSGNKAKILKSVEDGDALMFEITSRFLKRYYANGETAKLNEYAQMFLYILSEENRKNVTVRLNASPQLTYRTAAAGNPYTHRKGSVLVNKRDKNKNPIPSEIYKELYAWYQQPADKRNEYALSEESRAYVRCDV